MQQKYEYLDDLLEQDLSEWQFVFGYYLHPLNIIDENWNFPAARCGNDIIFTLDPGLLKLIWQELSPRRDADIRKSLLLVNKKINIGFEMVSRLKRITILTREKIERALRENESPFNWPPGYYATQGKELIEPEF